MDESLHLKSRLSHVSHVGWGRAGTTRTHVVTWVQHGAEPSRRPRWLPPQPVRRLPSWHGVLASEGLDVRSVEPMRWQNALGLTARDKDVSRDMAVELCRDLWPQCIQCHFGRGISRLSRRLCRLFMAGLALIAHLALPSLCLPQASSTRRGHVGDTRQDHTRCPMQQTPATCL